MNRSWLPWVLPYALFVAVNLVEGKAPGHLYPWIYLGKVALVSAVAVWSLRGWRTHLAASRAALGWGALAGIAGILLWIGVERIPYPHLGSRTAFDPFEAIADPGLRAAFLVARFTGLALLVPVIEEVFWRGFGLRYATDQDRWESLPLGAFSTLAAAIVAGLFALAHPEWLAAALYALGIGELLRRTRSLAACMVAHGVTNLLLGVWVVTQKAWELW